MENWNKAVFNKLQDINPCLNVSPSHTLANRQDHVILLRCRIGRTRVTISHSNVFLTGDVPFCIGCNVYFTFKHFFLECDDLTQVHGRYYRINKYTFRVFF
jgi:hypothetical protein